MGDGTAAFHDGWDSFTGLPDFARPNISKPMEVPSPYYSPLQDVWLDSALDPQFGQSQVEPEGADGLTVLPSALSGMPASDGQHQQHVKVEGDMDMEELMEEAASGEKRKKRSSASKATKPTTPTKRGRKKRHTSEQPAEQDEKRLRFLERNRVAASKCREKKKVWASNLETTVREMQSDRKQLSHMVCALRDECLELKGELLKHSTCNCDRIRHYLNQTADSITSSQPPYYREVLQRLSSRAPSMQTLVEGSQDSNSPPALDSSGATSTSSEPRDLSSADILETEQEEPRGLLADFVEAAALH
ncbi:MAG: hypothetical protein M1833_005772 [Piccolia ochrophora]|nr:MAG: hypothetical protein M1833_005772 [Piccolia ochrophora]